MLLVVAVAIVAFANGLGQPSLTPRASRPSQGSQAPIFTAIPPQAINGACVKQVGPFVSSLKSLDSGVGASVTFQDYSEMFKISEAARDQVHISELDPPCIAVFAAAQTVLGEHTEALNSWNDCTTTTGCTKESIESSLEAHWARAKATLSSVEASLP